jgi:hypothetical protein
MTEKWRKGKAPWEQKNQVRERDIEAYLRDETKKLVFNGVSAKAYKFVSPGNDGVPDRLLALPIGQAVFVELKAPGKKSTELQRKKQQELAGFGFVVFSDIDTREKVDKVINLCKFAISGTKFIPGVYLGESLK